MPNQVLRECLFFLNLRVDVGMLNVFMKSHDCQLLEMLLVDMYLNQYLSMEKQVTGCFHYSYFSFFIKIKSTKKTILNQERNISNNSPSGRTLRLVFLQETETNYKIYL